MIEAAELPGFARSTADVRAVEVAAEPSDIVGHVSDDWTVLKEVIAVGFAARAVNGRIPLVCVGPVDGLARWRHGACGHAVEVFEAVC